ncbi:carboxy terminal-processing peptidase [Thioalkalivibrio sp. XN279]|uniref:carboxy terminal-processing peptidase n=1 Tax=Thioalkalivibrio sp. XN279 TaxID=2714953 RepID=UPI00140C5072|nr:carboxy terminal-processing peptidase [Thioalkalivibrio sp. XN279]NHA13586.1 carboxy terminal-processing peptidase [Thioalkalivibrio sp. XN279]
MRIVKTSAWASIAALLAAALLAIPAAAAPPNGDEVLAPSDRHGKVSRLVTTLFERSHYRRMPVDDVASSRMLDAYLDALDGNRQYFLASDVEEFETWRSGLDDAVKRGQLDPVFEIYRRYVDRTRDRLEFALSQLEVEHDFTVDEEFVFDRAEAPWPVDEAELDDLWRKRVKNDALGLMLTGKDWDEAREILRGRYQQVLKRFDQVKSDDVFETFMNAFANTMDPHTSYYSPRNSEEYRIQMSLNYDGIGATLQLQDEYVAVINVIEGGPAALDGTLKPKDRITGVGQGEDGEIVDVVGWRLDEVVDLIRGPSGSTVRLQILPGGAAPGSASVVIPLVRDKVKLEAQAARKELLEIEHQGQVRRIGVITVPSFYQDYNARVAGAREYTSTTADVRRLTEELKAEGIDGLVLDLRNNGGGHLSEATAMTGLFIPPGPVVQLRDTSGRIEVLEEQAADPVYDGPLAVLVNRFSASASEIFAGAIQDYGRGIVIGQQTYGKGTVQNLYPLDRYAPGAEPRFGQLTLTVGKYYRVTGASTQHRGVVPDIIVPSPVDSHMVGESTRETALPWDQIRPTPFSRQGALGEAIEIVATQHQERRADDPNFRHLMGNIEAIEERRAQKSVSLNIETRRAENEAVEAEQLALENERRAALGLEALESLAEAEEEDAPDVLLQEAARMVVDLATLPGAVIAGRGAGSKE